MNKKLSLLILFLSMTTSSYAIENGGPAFLYDSAGNGLTSTTGALNVSLSASTIGVTQSTSPWVTKDLSDGSVTGGTAGTFSLLSGLVYTSSLPTLTTGQQVALQGDVNGRLLIRLLSSGTDSIAATQSGTWTVQPGNTPNTTPWLTTINQGGNSAAVTASSALKVDGSAVTQPVSGTVTANAGTGNFTVVQSSGANLHMDIDNFPATQPVSGTVTSIPTDGVKAAYTVVMTNIVPASAATDLFTIIGSGTKTVRIRGISLYGAQTVGGPVPISLVKRSTADTGGTSTTGTAVPWSSADSAATAVVSAYTANPTLGTSIGMLSYEIPFIPIVKDTLFEYNFSLLPYQVYTLNSAAETIAVNLNATTVTGGVVTLKINWTEE